MCIDCIWRTRTFCSATSQQIMANASTVPYPLRRPGSSKGTYRAGAHKRAPCFQRPGFRNRASVSLLHHPHADTGYIHGRFHLLNGFSLSWVWRDIPSPEATTHRHSTFHMPKPCIFPYSGLALLGVARPTFPRAFCRAVLAYGQTPVRCRSY